MLHYLKEGEALKAVGSIANRDKDGNFLPSRTVYEIVKVEDYDPSAEAKVLNRVAQALCDTSLRDIYEQKKNNAV